MKGLEKIKEEWCNIFRNLKESIARTLLLVVMGTIKAGSSNTAEIARQMSLFTKQSFNTNDVKLRRFLSNKNFQIDHGTWRCYFRFLLRLLKEKYPLTSNQNIPINVDFTTIKDRFLILFASVSFAGRAIPLYFSIRNYPRKKNQYNHKFMEQAFLNELRKLLPKIYRYTIVADRGFGNLRWMKACLNEGFDYVVRVQGSWKVETELGKVFYPSELKRKNYDHSEIRLVNGNFKSRLIVSHQAESEGWYLLTSLRNPDFKEVVRIYSERFKIEKMFQDLKSSGFCIEGTRILNYSKFKRLLFVCMISKVLMLFIGDWLQNSHNEIKKKYPIHTSIISVLSNSL